jgi:hypothetical protein
LHASFRLDIGLFVVHTIGIFCFMYYKNIKLYSNEAMQEMDAFQFETKTAEDSRIVPFVLDKEETWH